MLRIKLKSVHTIPLALTAVVFILNIILLMWIGAGFKTLFGSFLVQIIWTLGGSALINRFRVRVGDPVLFYLISYCIGLMILYFSGFVWLHRGLLGNRRELAVLAAFAPLCLLALIGIKQAVADRNTLSPIRTWPVAILLCVSFFVAALGTYGFENNPKNSRINKPEWRQTENMVPSWSWQSDRKFHYERVVVSTYEEGFPPERVNHRGFHVSVMSVTMLTGDMTRPRYMQTYKTMAWVFFFMLSYALYATGRKLLDLGDRLSVFVAASALVFSPLKLPLLAFSPTYRGFFSASGTLYHSDTQYTSMACSAVGIYLVLSSLKEKTLTFFLGCALIAGAFFLKPSNFIVLAPACYLFALICWRDFNKDRFWGLAVLLGAPILWFGYIHYSGSSSSMDSVIGRKTLSEPRAVEMGLKIQFFAGYLPRLQNRFPGWITGTPVLIIFTMTAMSFAAFWVGAFRALKQVIIETKLHPKRIIAHMHTHAHIYFCLAFFFAALLLSITLSEHKYRNINWKWAAAASYVLCLPVFAKGITLVKSTVLRRISWGLYGFQLMQGMGYLAYLFWYSRLS